MSGWGWRTPETVKPAFKNETLYFNVQRPPTYIMQIIFRKISITYVRLILTNELWVLARQDPVEDVVVPLQARLLVGDTGLLQQVCE
jgi:hypothetical protein